MNGFEFLRTVVAAALFRLAYSICPPGFVALARSLSEGG